MATAWAEERGRRRWLTLTVEASDLYGHAYAWWWGRAYRRPEAMEEVLAVIPLNLVMGLWVNKVYPVLRHGVWDKQVEAARAAGFKAGVEAGRWQGREEARENMKEATGEMLAKYGRVT